jgi:hypothetical protein
MADHLHSISILPATSAAVLALFIGDVGLTAIHTTQEVSNKMWRYFGAIAGMRFPDALGVFIFAGFVGGLFVTASFAGTLGALPIIGPLPVAVTVGAVGVTIASRISDAWYSHMELDRRGFRPNPGLGTAPAYLIEGLILPVIFYPGILAYPVAALIGGVIGWVTFVTVPFNFRAVRAMMPKTHAPVWRAGEPLPEWGH